MTQEEIERMESLCRLIQVEKDPKRFDALVLALNELLGERGQRLKGPEEMSQPK